MFVGVKLGVVPNLAVRGGDAWSGRAAVAESAGLVLSGLDEAVELAVVVLGVWAGGPVAGGDVGKWGWCGYGERLGSDSWWSWLL